MNKQYANKGVRCNKKPLKNIVYKVLVTQILNPSTYMEQFRFKDLGWLLLHWKYENDRIWCQHGFITIDYLKQLIGERQYAKFCQGKREFIIQRRVNNKNL